LQYPQQFGLQFPIQLAHLVKKDGPAISQRKASFSALGGTCKCPLFMTEEFALHKCFGNGCTINGDIFSFQKNIGYIYLIA
jgi:hypothetical protein